MIPPMNYLIEGSRVVQQSLAPHGFQFQFCGEGNASGGEFAWGEFIRGDRKLELHFRFSMGLVRYHIADRSASHEAYMQGLGVREKCRYPGFSEDPSGAFHDLAHDLALAEDFLSGSGEVLRRAAEKEMFETANKDDDLMAVSVGDVRKLGELRDRFRERRYKEVNKLAEALQYPDRMDQSERRMVQIARERRSNEEAK
jgi:hypothetical protein